jgi:hypothetical protein
MLTNLGIRHAQPRRGDPKALLRLVACASAITSPSGVTASLKSASRSARTCQIGALSFLSKYTKLASGAIYAGIPAKQIE